MNYAKYNQSINREFLDKEDLVNKIKNMRCDGNIMLEPRLQEYIKMKKFNKENNIQSCVSLEKTYQITNKDKKLIKSFLMGKTNVYSNEKINQTKEKNKKQYFPSKSFRDNDERVPVPNKQEFDIPKNMGMFVPDKCETYYDERMVNKNIDIMDSRDFAYKTIKGFDLDDTRFDPRSDPMMFPGYEKNNKYSSQYRIDPDPRNKYIISDLNDPSTNINTNTNTFHDHSEYKRTSNNQIINDDLEKILSNNFNYGNFAAPFLSEKSDVDYDSKKFIPNIASKSKYINSSAYAPMPYINHDNQQIDRVVETDLIRGMPTNTTKSYGYRNPVENYFQYIEEDFVNPDNTDLPWSRGGESTRRTNRAVAKQKHYRDFTATTN